LVADDSPTIQKIAAGILKNEGFEVETVSNGVAAIKRLVAIHPILVLADVSMPGRDGYEVCEFVKKSPDLSHVPVLLVASDMEPYDSARGMEVGADGIIMKPFEPHDLISNVRKCVERYEAQVAARVEPLAPSATPEPQPELASTSEALGETVIFEPGVSTATEATDFSESTPLEMPATSPDSTVEAFGFPLEPSMEIAAPHEGSEPVEALSALDLTAPPAPETPMELEEAPAGSAFWPPSPPAGGDDRLLETTEQPAPEPAPIEEQSAAPFESLPADETPVLPPDAPLGSVAAPEEAALALVPTPETPNHVDQPPEAEVETPLPALENPAAQISEVAFGAPAVSEPVWNYEAGPDSAAEAAGFPAPPPQSEAEPAADHVEAPAAQETAEPALSPPLHTVTNLESFSLDAASSGQVHFGTHTAEAPPPEAVPSVSVEENQVPEPAQPIEPVPGYAGDIEAPNQVLEPAPPIGPAPWEPPPQPELREEPEIPAEAAPPEALAEAALEEPATAETPAETGAPETQPETPLEQGVVAESLEQPAPSEDVPESPLAESSTAQGTPEESAPELAAAPPAFDPNLIYYVVHRAVVRMAPPVLPAGVVDALARKLADEIAAELNSQTSHSV
jgi:CheY-like chemotaxis protein